MVAKGLGVYWRAARTSCEPCLAEVGTGAGAGAGAGEEGALGVVAGAGAGAGTTLVCRECSITAVRNASNL